MVKLKIILIGPVKAGKSTIANFLSEAIDYTNDEYRPTPGVRILEFEIPNRKVEIELWDCSGEDKYEPIWPVFLLNASGVVLVFNPEDSDQLPTLDRLHDYFVSKSLVTSSNALVIANCKEPTNRPPTPDLSGPLSSVTYINTNVFESGDSLRSSFEQFVSSIVTDPKGYTRDDIGLLSLPI